jgi:hypothetical protein
MNKNISKELIMKNGREYNNSVIYEFTPDPCPVETIEEINVKTYVWEKDIREIYVYIPELPISFHVTCVTIFKNKETTPAVNRQFYIKLNNEDDEGGYCYPVVITKICFGCTDNANFCDAILETGRLDDKCYYKPLEWKKL